MDVDETDSILDYLGGKLLGTRAYRGIVKPRLTVGERDLLYNLIAHIRISNIVNRQVTNESTLVRA